MCQRRASVRNTIILAYDAIPYGLARRDPTAQTSPPARSTCSTAFILHLGSFPCFIQHHVQQRLRFPAAAHILHRNLATTSHATFQNRSPSSERCRSYHKTSKDFGRAYELRNVKGNPWCERSARYLRRRAIHPLSLTNIENSLGHMSLIYAPVRNTTQAHLGPPRT